MFFYSNFFLLFNYNNNFYLFINNIYKKYNKNIIKYYKIL